MATNVIHFFQKSLSTDIPCLSLGKLTVIGCSLIYLRIGFLYVWSHVLLGSLLFERINLPLLIIFTDFTNGNPLHFQLFLRNLIKRENGVAQNFFRIKA